MTTLVTTACLGITLFAVDTSKPAWKFDPNSLKISSEHITGFLRPVGEMHGLVIEQMGDDASPVAKDRAFLNLEHYLEAGRWAEYLPRQLDHTVTMNANRLSIQFPQPKDWPVKSTLTYTWTTPDAIDAKLNFTFTGEMTQFEVYFTSYMASQYERSIRVNNEWVRPKISDSEQLLIPRDDRIAGRYEDGRWDFLKGRTRLSDQRFDLPITVSRDDATGWTIVQMIEPATCTHIAPNRFAVGHNFIIGGWDVKAGETRSARIRMAFLKNPTTDHIETLYEAFADACRKEQAATSAK